MPLRKSTPSVPEATQQKIQELDELDAASEANTNAIRTWVQGLGETARKRRKNEELIQQAKEKYGKGESKE